MLLSPVSIVNELQKNIVVKKTASNNTGKYFDEENNNQRYIYFAN